MKTSNSEIRKANYLKAEKHYKYVLVEIKKKWNDGYIATQQHGKLLEKKNDLPE